MISYSTNFMGPAYNSWYEERGLKVTQEYAGGRIDIRGEGTGAYGDETDLPVMLSSDYNRFSLWLDNYETEEIQHWDAILKAYYADGNPTITFGSELKVLTK